MRSGILQQVFDHHHHGSSTRASFAAPGEPGADDPMPASKFNGKMDDEELIEEKKMEQAGMAGPNANITPEAPAPLSDESQPKMPTKSTRDQRWKKWQEQMNYVLSKGNGKENHRCRPARPIPQWSKADVLENAPVFNMPKLPLCTRKTKECPYKIDRKENKLVRIVEKTEEESDATSGETANGEPTGPEAGEAEEGFGGGDWPFNQALLALLRPLPAQGRLIGDHPRCMPMSAKCSARKGQSVEARNYSTWRAFL
mmetsp:Transcript_36398/g.58303  ORF Transcript_36398/g.58303 Transcript_36398/m.58303 type:complete len:256 (-) Transcript_36398:14-781(-)